MPIQSRKLLRSRRPPAPRGKRPIFPGSKDRRIGVPPPCTPIRARPAEGRARAAQLAPTVSHPPHPTRRRWLRRPCSPPPRRRLSASLLRLPNSRHPGPRRVSRAPPPPRVAPLLPSVAAQPPHRCDLDARPPHQRTEGPPQLHPRRSSSTAPCWRSSSSSPTRWRRSAPEATNPACSRATSCPPSSTSPQRVPASPSRAPWASSAAASSPPSPPESTLCRQG